MTGNQLNFHIKHHPICSVPISNWQSLGVWVLACLAMLACGGSGESQTLNAPPFSDQTKTSNIDFLHINGFTGVFFLSEIMGAGSALFDYDNDGDLDLYLVQSHDLDAQDPHKPNTQFQDKLYRNNLIEDGSVTFTDVTQASGIQAYGYGMGVAVADYDNDGFLDLYVTTIGDNQLWRNQGNGTFVDVTQQAGVNDPLWSVSASWFDYDRDGLLDLYVGNFTDFNYDNNRQCFGAKRDYCSPLSYNAALDSLYRNLGDGTFEDVSKKAGIHAAEGRALGVIAADYDNDGWQDVYIANDSSANQLWINQKDGTFKDTAMLAGAALNQTGMPEASMGVDAGDFDNDGDEDLFMTHLGNQTNTIYSNNGKGWFEDLSNLTGLGSPSLPFTGFGTAWFDYDNDSHLDLFIANGAVKRPDKKDPPDVMEPYKERNQLFHNTGKASFTEILPGNNDPLAVKEVSRATSFGDIDNDGDIDMILTNNAGPARFLRNDVGQNNDWMGFRLLNSLGVDALGAKIRVAFSNGSNVWRRCRTDGSYASSNDPRVVIGLPDNSAKPKSIEVFWPNGKKEVFPAPIVGRYQNVEQGKGKTFE